MSTPEVVSPPTGLVSPPADVSAVTAAMESVSVQRSEPVVKKGSAGKEAKMTVNYVRLELAEEKRGMYEYEVRFEPPKDSRDERFKLIGSMKEVFGPTKTSYKLESGRQHWRPSWHTTGSCSRSGPPSPRPSAT